MFDITSTKLLILAVVALLVVGPKDFPLLLRTVGKYMGMLKRQAAEFRAQFDEAMRESELAELKKEVETIGRETEATLREVETSVDKEMGEVTREVESAVDAARSGSGETTTTNADAPASAGTDPQEMPMSIASDDVIAQTPAPPVETPAKPTERTSPEPLSKVGA